MEFFIILGIAFAIVGLLAVISFVIKKKRTAELQKIAESLELDFNEEVDLSWLNVVAHLPLFAIRRHHSSVPNFIRGHVGDIEFSLFDWKFSASTSSDSDPVFNQTVILFQAEKFAIPDVVVHPRRGGRAYCDDAWRSGYHTFYSA